MKLSMIAAMDRNGCIGKDGGRPWDFAGDLEHFRKTVAGSPVIMGRRTYELDVRKVFVNSPTIILSREKGYGVTGAKVCCCLAEALVCCEVRGAEKVYIIGGAEVYRIGMDLADELIVTYLPMEVEGGDCFFPPVEPDVWQEVRHAELEQGERVVWYTRKE